MAAKRRRYEPDANEAAFAVAQKVISISEGKPHVQIVGRGAVRHPEKPGAPMVLGTFQKNPAAVALGKLGGAKGGKARAAALSPKRRVAIAKKAATARWAKRP